jgi:hypothetical protein
LVSEKQEEYELLPHEEIEELRRAVQEIKEDPIGEKKAGKTLMQGITELNGNLMKLIHIFESAQEDLLTAYSESSPTKLLKDISDQNKKMAEGMLGLAELLKEQKTPVQQQRPIPRMRPNIAPQGLNMNAPPSMPQSEPFSPNLKSPPETRRAPPINNPSMPPMNSLNTPPGELPPPQELPKKKSLFSRK